ncbi:24791_t:CDS:2 [Entrophospora sp. SA101]|nr:14120_t:CDS:2 [Entrophospora sp. SA101]CAJ0644577.1 7723_t:CDS:2 [Entrophospora sp. SA101]CAJ0746217.1 24791_t:CDS:2 [Entrophospora sp. SA101]CAJ0844309.1 14620_t:CDS:2 [Entrophospora sp. SA101]CAJ0897134.1 5950_t:CDS:2 [Entrophospora sp. SA101]
MNFVEEYEIRKLKFTAIDRCKAANASDFLCSNTSRKVKRPSNQFIIFSTIYGKLLKDIVNEISTRIDIPNDAKKLLTQKLCSIVWNEMNKQEKSCFNTLAKQIKDQHTQRFPDYSFNPNKARNLNPTSMVYSSLESMKLPLLFFSPVGLNSPTPSLLSLPLEFNEFEDNDYHL